MAKYTGKTARVNATPHAIAAKFENLSVLAEHTDRLPADQRAKIGQLRFETDAIIIKNPAVGEMAFRIIERSDKAIVFHADGMLPLTIDVNLDAVDGDPYATDVTTVLDIEIPAMLKPLLGSKLQHVADSFGDLVGKLAATPNAE